MSALKRLAKKQPTPTSSKSTKPQITDESLSQNIKEFLEAKAVAKTAAATIARAEQQIIEKASEARVDHCTKFGQYESSMKVTASTGSVTVKFPNRYSKISTDEEENLKDVFGEDYDRYFREKTVATLTEAAMNDDAFIEDMIATLGEEKFGRYFSVSSHIEPVKQYHEQCVLSEDLARKHNEAVNQGLVNPTKPSLTA